MRNSSWCSANLEKVNQQAVKGRCYLVRAWGSLLELSGCWSTVSITQDPSCTDLEIWIMAKKKKKWTWKRILTLGGHSSLKETSWFQFSEAILWRYSQSVLSDHNFNLFYFFFFLLFLRNVFGSQQNWNEDTEICLIPPTTKYT